ncbi:MAG: hypothetical protein AAGI36_18520 [Pseudomonadota bacterium]
MFSFLTPLTALFATFGVVGIASSSGGGDDNPTIASDDAMEGTPTGNSAAADSDAAGDTAGNVTPGDDAQAAVGAPVEDPPASGGAEAPVDDGTPSYPDASPFAFFGADGQLVLEAESGASEGDWEEITVDGETAMLWDADRSSYGSAPDNQAITFDFVVEETGSYSISLHGARVFDVMNDSDRYHGDGSLRTDTGNDVYIKITDADTDEVIIEPTKLYVGLGDRNEELRWGSTFDTHSDGHYPAAADIEADRNYTLEVIGRSDAFALDRITLGLDGRLYDEDVEESPLLTDYIATLPDTESAGDPDAEDDLVDMV